jgi:hypothetical protein
MWKFGRELSLGAGGIADFKFEISKGGWLAKAISASESEVSVIRNRAEAEQTNGNVEMWKLSRREDWVHH